MGREERDRTVISGMEPRRIAVVMLPPRAELRKNIRLSRRMYATIPGSEPSSSRFRRRENITRSKSRFGCQIPWMCDSLLWTPVAKLEFAIVLG